MDFIPYHSDSIHSQHQPSNSSDHDTKSKSLGRRHFFRRTAVVAGIAAAGAAFTTVDTHEAMAQASGRVTLRDQIRLVQRHENEHVTFLLTALGSSARPKPTFQNLDLPNLAAFLGLSRALENTGVGAYLGAAPAILNLYLLSAAGSIALVEARHAGMFNSLQSRPVTENAFGQETTFDRAFTAAEVRANAGPYIASLNGGPAIDYDPVNRSAANDIMILNFALALEYLEADYYNINVPKFYP